MLTPKGVGVLPRPSLRKQILEAGGEHRLKAVHVTESTRDTGGLVTFSPCRFRKRELSGDIAKALNAIGET